MGLSASAVVSVLYYASIGCRHAFDTLDGLEGIIVFMAVITKIYLLDVKGFKEYMGPLTDDIHRGNYEV